MKLSNLVILERRVQQVSLEFPTDLNSKMSSVYLKEIRKKMTKMRHMLGISQTLWSQNRPDLRSKSYKNDRKIVDAENIFFWCCK